MKKYEKSLVSWIVDASQEGSTNVLNALICSLLIGHKLLPYKIIRDFDSTKENYVDAFLRIIEELKSEHGIEVVSIVSDNLRTQVSAIQEILKMDELKKYIL